MGEAGGLEFSVVPEKLHLIDMSRRYVSAKRSTSQGVLIPHAAIGYTPGDDPAVHTVQLESAAGRILAAAHRALVSASLNDDHEEKKAIEGAFVELVRRLMLGQQPPGDTAPQQDLSGALLVRNLVAENLEHDRLDANYLCAAAGMSRATLYRHFADEGGVTHYIRNRRLDRCFFEFAGSAPERGRIKTIAERWHFTDASHFNRLFRERFGRCPSDCLASSDTKPPVDAPSELRNLSRTWLGQL
jgi:AraC-like DNA-binding protein